MLSLEIGTNRKQKEIKTMNTKKKGLLQLLFTVVVIAACAFIVLFGVGKWNRGKAENINLGLDLAGGVSVTYEAVDKDVTEKEMNLTLEKLKQRVQTYSLESDVYLEGNNRINVDIPGEEDAKKVLAELGEPATVEFKDQSGKVLLDGSMISEAQGYAGVNSSTGRTEYKVLLEFTKEGSTKFAEATAANVGKIIYIYYDGEIVSAPTVNEAIKSGSAEINNMTDYEEAQKLATFINIGALPVELKSIRTNIVGAKLGSDALDKSLIAGAIGLIVVMVFMIVVYRIPGVAASIALCLYVLLMLITLNWLNITLTLPGVAGIVLSIGMAVDANVIIFTRIKEELAKGKTVRSSMRLGFNKALSAIVDGNVTTLIAAAVLYFVGSGTIQGFAQTLAIGIVLSMFTALLVTKTIMNMLFNLGFNSEKFYGITKERKYIPVVSNFKKFAGISIAIVLIGFGFMGYHKAAGDDILNFGLDFKGGTSTEIQLGEDTELTETLKNQISDSVKEIVGETPVISAVENQNSYVIKTTTLDEDKTNALQEMFTKDYGISAEHISSETISPTVSNEMKTNAVKAVLIATVCMLIYIWIRFKDIRFGSSAVIALIHDVLIVLTVYAILRGLSVGNTFIACMLTIVGYSINATIVIFDRIRENVRGRKTIANLDEVVNDSINQTLTRSIYTSLTTFIMVFFLYIFGVEALREFALPLMVGIIGGAYSSIFITGSLWYVMRRKKQNK